MERRGKGYRRAMWLAVGVLLLGLVGASMTTAALAKVSQQLPLPHTFRGTIAFIDSGGTSSLAPLRTEVEARINGEFRGCLLPVGASISRESCTGITVRGEYGGDFANPDRVDLLVQGMEEEVGASIQFFVKHPRASTFVRANETATFQPSAITDPFDLTAATPHLPSTGGGDVELPGNQPPVANDDGATLPEDGTMAIDVLANDSDPDGDPLTVTNLGDPLNGTAILNTDGTIQYTPDPDFNGADPFTYTANDGATDSNLAMVRVAVTAVDDAPLTVDDSYRVDEGGTLAVDPSSGVLDNDRDIEGDPLIAILVSGVSHGILTLEDDGAFTYAHDGGESSMDSFTYAANDGSQDSSTATATLIVDPVNDPPVAASDTAVVAEESFVIIDVLANDSDPEGDPLTATNLGDPLNGTATLHPDGTVHYTPGPGFIGTDTFTYTANDGIADSAPTTVSVVVTAAAPTFSFQIPLASQSALEDLIVTPDTVNCGSPTTVRFRIVNQGTASGAFSVDVLVNGATVATETGSLDPDGSTLRSLFVTRTIPGSYTIEVGDLATSLIVPGPALQLTNFQVSPISVASGDDVTVSADIGNTGGCPGEYDLEFDVSGAGVEDAVSGTLAPGASAPLRFTTSREDAGAYAVTISGPGASSVSGQFIVLSPAVDTTVETSTTVDPDASSSRDDQGNDLSVVEGDISLEEGGSIDLVLPVLAPPGVRVVSFEDLTSGARVDGTQVEIPLKGPEAGEVLLTLFAELEEMPVGTGSDARARVREGTLELRVPQKRADFSLDDPAVGLVEFSVDALLLELPQGARIRVSPHKQLSPKDIAGLADLARAEDKTVSDVGYVLKVESENLENGVEIDAATIRMAIGAGWVDSIGLDNVVISRLTEDGGKELLETGFIGMDGQGRFVFEGVSPGGFSSFALIGLAPRPASFFLTELLVTPSVVEPGQVAVVSAQVTNEGSGAGILNLSIEVNGQAEETQTVTLGPGASTTLAFRLRPEEEGAYDLRIEELVGVLEVARPLSPVNVSPSDLRVVPAQVLPGEPVTVTATLTNTGEVEGSTTAVLMVNDVFVESRQVKAPPGTPITVEFTLVEQLEGTYEVTIQGLAESAIFSVVRPALPATFQYSLFTASPLSVQVGQLVVFTVLAENLGDTWGSSEAVLTINGQEAERQQVSLGAKSGQVLAYQHTPQEAGLFRAGLNGMAIGFEVREALAASNPDPISALAFAAATTPMPVSASAISFDPVAVAAATPTPTPSPTNAPLPTDILSPAEEPSPAPMPQEDDRRVNLKPLLGLLAVALVIQALGIILFIRLRRRGRI